MSLVKVNVRLLAQRERLTAETSPYSGYRLHLYMGQSSGGKICPRGHVLMAALGWLFFTRDLFPKNTVWWAVEMSPVPEPRPQQTKKHGPLHGVSSSSPASLWFSRKPDLGRGATRLSSPPEELQHQQGPHIMSAGVAKSLQLTVCLSAGTPVPQACC